MLTECQPGDLLRVTGNLTLPDTADGRMRLQADTLEVLWEAPLSQPPQEDAPVGGHGDRNRAILALAEALTGFADESTPGDRPDIRINIGPVGINELNVALCHSIDVTTARTHQLADAIDAMRAMLNSRPQPIDDWPDPRTLADLTDYFDGLDLTDLTRAVLEETRPVDRVAVTRALADMVGDIPVPGIEDTDQ
ncbi:hypothetical protein G3H79_40840 (plasmid) [Streptomyces aureoverticillatus]|nr:hypothetical protein G3H79_40840 [Streptomyces aureoverticillatus]